MHLGTGACEKLIAASAQSGDSNNTKRGYKISVVDIIDCVHHLLQLWCKPLPLSASVVESSGTLQSFCEPGLGLQSESSTGSKTHRSINVMKQKVWLSHRWASAVSQGWRRPNAGSARDSHLLWSSVARPRQSKLQRFVFPSRETATFSSRDCCAMKGVVVAADDCRESSRHVLQIPKIWSGVSLCCDAFLCSKWNQRKCFCNLSLGRSAAFHHEAQLLQKF